MFDRPERLNALTFEVYADLRDLLGEIPHRGDVSVLVITRLWVVSGSSRSMSVWIACAVAGVFWLATRKPAAAAPLRCV